jgi:sugar phosphate isomerase/epimerase
MPHQDTRLYSRREFGRLALAGLPALSTVAPRQARGDPERSRRVEASALSRLRIDSRINGVRIGVQSYGFRTLPLEAAIKGMTDIGIGECELWSGHVEPRPAGVTPGGPPADPAARAAAREKTREWRLTTPLDHFTAVRKQFEAAGIRLQAYNLSFNDSFTDEEIDRGFEMARALGAGFITASSTLTAAKRVAPFAEKHQMTVAMHGHANLVDPNEFAKPESFAQAMAMSKRFAVNLDIGHFFAAGFDPISYIEQHHDRITNLHLKDRKKSDGPNMPWGEGETPIKEVLQLLRQKRYDIPANIEYEYKGEDPVVEVRKCFEYCKAALA